MDIENRLLTGNKDFVNHIDKSLSKELVNGQHPFALIITCSDSRVIPEEIFSCSLGELFVIRTAGNVVNEGELATIEYAIEHLHINYILVLGHTLCGAVHASIRNEKGKYLSPILDNIKKNISNECDEEKASWLNALAQVTYIKNKFPEYNGTVKAGIYDIRTNKVSL